MQQAPPQMVPVVDAIAGFAGIAVHTGQQERAARLLGAAAGLAEARMLARIPYHAFFRQTEAATRAALGDAGFTAAWTAGHLLPVD